MEREEEKKRETESEECWIFPSTYTAPEGSGRSDWP